MTLAVHPRLPPQRARKRHPFCSPNIGKVHVELYTTDDMQSSNAVWINAYLGVARVFLYVQGENPFFTCPRYLHHLKMIITLAGRICPLELETSKYTPMTIWSNVALGWTRSWYSHNA
jgi:hypothetical protein